MKNTEPIKKMIVKAHAAGKCDIDGHSVRRADGSMVAKPRTMTASFAKTYKWDQGEFYKA